MEIGEVFLLEAAVADLESGRLFYEEQQEKGVGFICQSCELRKQFT
jgi:hypothetical protein